jgi:hypothetical protein
MLPPPIETISSLIQIEQRQVTCTSKNKIRKGFQQMLEYQFNSMQPHKTPSCPTATISKAIQMSLRQVSSSYKSMIRYVIVNGSREMNRAQSTPVKRRPVQS